MKLEFILLALLAAGSNAGNDNSKLQDESRDRDFRRRKLAYKCDPRSTASPATTTIKCTTTIDPCSGCRDAPITISDTAAGQCIPIVKDGTCKCRCGDVFCLNDPYAGCENFLNDTLSVGDTVAGYCYPQPSENGCNCLCADLFCQNGQIIDRRTCVSGGSISNCKCVDTATTPRPTTTQTCVNINGLRHSDGMGFQLDVDF